jgi:hypothetical protein
MKREAFFLYQFNSRANSSIEIFNKEWVDVLVAFKNNFAELFFIYALL